MHPVDGAMSADSNFTSRINPHKPAHACHSFNPKHSDFDLYLSGVPDCFDRSSFLASLTTRDGQNQHQNQPKSKSLVRSSSNDSNLSQLSDGSSAAGIHPEGKLRSITGSTMLTQRALEAISVKTADPNPFDPDPAIQVPRKKKSSSQRKHRSKPADVPDTAPVGELCRSTSDATTTPFSVSDFGGFSSARTSTTVGGGSVVASPGASAGNRHGYAVANVAGQAQSHCQSDTSETASLGSACEMSLAIADGPGLGLTSGGPLEANLNLITMPHLNTCAMPSSTANANPKAAQLHDESSPNSVPDSHRPSVLSPIPSCAQSHSSASSSLLQNNSLGEGYSYPATMNVVMEQQRYNINSARAIGSSSAVTRRLPSVNSSGDPAAGPGARSSLD